MQLKYPLWLNDQQSVKVLKSLNNQQSHILIKFTESKEPIQFKLSYDMSINNFQVIKKSCIDHKSNTWFTLCSKSETLVIVFKLLNNWHSEFTESSTVWTDHVQAILQYVNREVSSNPRKILYYKYENMRDCKIVTPESCVRVSYEVWCLLLAGNFLAHMKN